MTNLIWFYLGGMTCTLIMVWITLPGTNDKLANVLRSVIVWPLFLYELYQEEKKERE